MKAIVLGSYLVVQFLYETIDGKFGIALPVYISASAGLPTATVDLKPSKTDREND